MFHTEDSKIHLCFFNVFSVFILISHFEFPKINFNDFNTYNNNVFVSQKAKNSCRHFKLGEIKKKANKCYEIISF